MESQVEAPGRDLELRLQHSGNGSACSGHRRQAGRQPVCSRRLCGLAGCCAEWAGRRLMGLCCSLMALFFSPPMAPIDMSSPKAQGSSVPPKHMGLSVWTLTITHCRGRGGGGACAW